MTEVLFNNLILLFVVFAVSCQEKDCCTDGGELTGSWQLYETGYSPGAGYVTKAVPSKPAQVITFHSDLTMSTNIGGFQDYKFYRIIDDAGSGGRILAWFKEEPGDLESVAGLQRSYTMRISDNHLNLRYRGCTDGCHMGLRRK